MREFALPMPKLSPGTRKSVIAILLLGAAAVLLLASFGKAGPAGDFLFNVLYKLFGWGYYLWPSIALLLAFSFLLSHEEKFLGMTLLGVIGFITSGLGIIDVVFPQKGGWVGNVIGSLEVPFGYTASIILLVCLTAASLLIALNAKIVLTKKEREEFAEEEVEEVKPTPAPKIEQKPVVVKSADGKKETMVLADIKHREDWPDEVIERLSEEVYVTIDLDGFDPAIMSSVGTPEPGGLGWYEVLGLLRKLSKRKRIVGFDVMELLPEPGNVAPDFLAAKLVYKLAAYTLREF